MALIQCCLKENDWNGIHWRNMLVQGLEKKAWRGVGRFFTQAVHQMRKGVKIEETGSPSAGMGAAMRVGPLGAYHKDEEIRLQAALESSLATHRDARAAVFAGLIVQVVASFIQGATVKEVMNILPRMAKRAEKKVQELAKRGWNVLQPSNTEISEAIEQVTSWHQLPITTMRGKISELARPLLQKGFTRAHPNQGFILLGGLHALVMACREDLEPNEILLSIIREGFDTDTVAAIAGSILGARYGTDWIPVEACLDHQRLQRYADAFVTSQLPEEWEEFLAREAEWTKKEKQFSQRL
jgi:ADP-ribosylglycohydrolase